MTELFKKLKAAYPEAKCELNYSTPFELLVSVVLSAQCTDKRVNRVTEILFKDYNTAEKLANACPTEIERIIRSCGFFKTKSASIIGCAKSLCERFNGAVPADFDLLLTLKGVGRKTASVVLVEAFNIPAVPVDTHVFRVSRRLNLSQGKTPERVESDLKKAFPQSEWCDLHKLLIFHGRYVCKAGRPLCKRCPVRTECAFIVNNNEYYQNT